MTSVLPVTCHGQSVRAIAQIILLNYFKLKNKIIVEILGRI